MLFGELDATPTNRFLKQLAAQEHLFPNGVRKQPSLSTLRRKLRQYRRTGFDGLARKPRADRGRPRAHDPKIIEKAIELKRDQPRRSEEAINQFLSAWYGKKLPKSTLYRFLKQAGATRIKLGVSRRAKLKRRCLIDEKDKTILEQWRTSSDKRLWERAVVILDSCDSTIEELSAKTDNSVTTIHRWIRVFNERGVEGLRRRKRDRTQSNKKLELKTRRVLEILHDRPKSFEINRSNWSLATLAKAYDKRHNESISRSTVARLINAAGYKVRKARRVLTSPDPAYREKVELLLQTLQCLKPTEMLFFIDELGPLQVKRYGGRCYAPRGRPPTVRDTHGSKGSVTLFGALSATSNQVTWFYGKAKDTDAMIDLAEILFNQYHDKSRLYITWDAASWHGSDAVTSWLDAFNSQTRGVGEGPTIELLPLPSRSQFRDVIEAVFSGMKRAVIHHSDYASEYEMKSVISTHVVERHEYFENTSKRVGNKIWEVDFFADCNNIRSGDYREW